MEKLKVGSLFSGIGAIETSLTNKNINHELKWFSEIDEPAIKSYCAINKVDKLLNKGDITKIDINSLPYVDLICHGSPCQDYSLGGLQKGGDINSGTRSSLMWYSVKIISHIKPKYVIWENVNNVLSPKHKHNFDKYIEDLGSIGYKSYYKILNPIDYNIPHDRKRIFCISILEDNVDFMFPKEIKLTKFLLDILDTNNKTSDVSDIVSMHIDYHYENKIKIKKDYPITVITEIRPSRCSIKTNGISPCLVAKMGTGGNNVPIIAEWKRPFTLHECMRLMGFSDKHTDLMISTGNAKSQMYKQVGNSISVTIMELIVEQLFKSYILENVDKSSF